VLKFWHALGFSTVQDVTKSGNEYWCQSLGVDVHVRFTQVSPSPGSETSAAVVSALKRTALVEASAPATDRDFPHVCRALSEFAESLQPLVQLTNSYAPAHVRKKA
jgi:hypothetical protein